MAYLKPQSPLRHKSGDYFYPLTTADQVVMDDGSRLNTLNYISINNENAIEGEVNPVNADTLGGHSASDFALASDVSIQINTAIEQLRQEILGGAW
jgi:hypothetical protein